MKTCCIGLCLLLAGTAVSHGWGLPYEMVFGETKEDFIDAVKLKGVLRSSFTGNRVWQVDPVLYKRRFGISDGTLRAVLMEICRESAENVKWEPFLDEDPQELRCEKKRLRRSILWLGACADRAAKDFLMGIAVDGAKGEVYRIYAIDAYICSADAREVRDALARFLIGDMKVNDYSTYLCAFEVYDDAEDDAQKREAIAASLIVALAREESNVRFADMDKELAERSAAYATSHQRLALLRKNDVPDSVIREKKEKMTPAVKPGGGPPVTHTTDLEVYMPNLKASRKALEAKWRWQLTNVSTNLTELMERDFSKPEGK